MKIKYNKSKEENLRELDVDLLDYINIPPTTGDVTDFKPFNHDLKYASFFPTPGRETIKSPQPYIDEYDEVDSKFFGGEDVESEEDGVADESLPKINYANKKNRFVKLKRIFMKI